jgi:peptidoglycan lytic transglycosylase
VKVTNKRNGRSVMVRINDRGPFIKGRIIDVTPMAAEALGFFHLAPVTLSVID